MITTKEFIKKYNGKYVDTTEKGHSKPDWNDGVLFTGQCASLVRAYLVQVKGLPNRSYGDGKSFDENIPKVTNRAVNIGRDLRKAKNGDILVWDHMGVNGHVAIYFNGKMFSSNPNAAKLIPIWAGVTDIIRINDSAPKVTNWKSKKAYSATTPVIKRLTPTASGNNVYGLFKPKDKPIWFHGEVRANGRDWYVYKNVKGKLTYVAKQYLKAQPNYGKK